MNTVGAALFASTIQRRLVAAAAVARHSDGLKSALATVKSASEAVAEALNGFGGSLTASAPGPGTAPALDLLT